MSRCARAATFAVLSIMWCAVSASAETMRCQSVNGNLNCSGSDGVACQTINGKRVCVSGHGDIVQSFGGDGSSDWSGHDAEMDATGKESAGKESAGDIDVPALERQWKRDHALLLQQNGSAVHLRTDRLSIDRD
jgi:DUF4097 and DUF4098 domain-containing protein YvlB